MHKQNGIFLEYFFGFLGIALIIDNRMGEAIICFIIVLIIDNLWSY